MMKPGKILLFFLLTGAFLLPAVLFIPKGGIDLWGFKLKMLSINDMLGRDTVKYADISNIVDVQANPDSLPDVLDMTPSNVDTLDGGEQDSVGTAITAEELAAAVQPLDYNEEGKANLQAFFALLRGAKYKKNQIRIMHYGDSQIERGRITSFIRHKLQQRFGGRGPGLMPAIQPYGEHYSVTQSNTGNWQRFTTFTKPDTLVKHKRYGMLASFSRFAPLANDSLPPNDSIVYKASVSLSKARYGYPEVRKFRRVSLYYGNARTKTRIEVISDSLTLAVDSLAAGTKYHKFTYTFPQYSDNVTLRFSGYDSPDIYAIDLSDTHGVDIDNIGLRGSPGTFFTRIDYAQLAGMYKDLNVKMFILQFGGNVMPYTHDTLTVERYTRWFYAQLMRLKKMVPEVSIVVIGPSDMSYKSGEKFITYDYLPLLVDKMREVTLKAGFCYWDMYAAMGGHNSMPSWVNADPPLASPDYAHFTVKGSKLIANMFYNALMLELVGKKFEKAKEKPKRQ